MAERVVIVLQENQQRFPGWTGQIKVHGQQIYYHLVCGFFGCTDVARTTRNWDPASFPEKANTGSSHHPDVHVFRQSNADESGWNPVATMLDPPVDYILDVLQAAIAHLGTTPLITLKSRPLPNLKVWSMANIFADGRVDATFCSTMVGVPLEPDQNYNGQIGSEGFTKLLQDVRCLNLASGSTDNEMAESEVLLKAEIIHTGSAFTRSSHEVLSTESDSHPYREVVSSLEGWYRAAQSSPENAAD